MLSAMVAVLIPPPPTGAAEAVDTPPIAIQNAIAIPKTMLRIFTPYSYSTGGDDVAFKLNRIRMADGAAVHLADTNKTASMRNPGMPVLYSAPERLSGALTDAAAELLGAVSPGRLFPPPTSAHK
jgi:hypothetical protein